MCELKAKLIASDKNGKLLRTYVAEEVQLIDLFKEDSEVSMVTFSYQEIGQKPFKLSFYRSQMNLED